MKISKIYSYFNGFEFLLIRKPWLWTEIRRVIALVDAKAPKAANVKNRASASVNLNAAMLFAQFGKHFCKRDWRGCNGVNATKHPSKLRCGEFKTRIRGVQYEIETIEEASISRYDEIDFVKERVLVEVQLGKTGCVTSDLLIKHRVFYVRDQIDLGIEILPMKELQQDMSSGPGYYEGEIYNVIRNGRGVPGVPLVIVGISP